jgi:hypothetical protein
MSMYEGWLDEEIEVFQRRLGRFTKAGMDAMEAEKLAQQMLYRDRPESGDDRRICVECKGFHKGFCNFAESMGLRRGMAPVWNVLQRCDGFVLRGSAC